MGRRGEVLVAIVNNQHDFAVAREQHWYRIPVSSMRKWLHGRWPPRWLAFYQTKVFGPREGHFRAMLTTAKERGFQPQYVAFDNWYSGLANLKAIRDHGWQWLTRLKANRQVNMDGSGNRAVSDWPSREAGTRVHLKGYGCILVLRIDTTDGDAECWATSDLTMTMDERTTVADQVWTIESSHRGLKQYWGVERCAARSARAQRNHIGWAIRTFLRLEHHRIATGTSWFNTKRAIIRPALQQFLAGPKALLDGFEQATLAHKRATA